METLKFLNVSEAKIQVKENLCGFIPAMIEINDEKKGSIFLNFGDISSITPPSKVGGDLFVCDFSNPVDGRLNQVLKDEEIENDPLSGKFEFLLPEKLHAQFARCPFVQSVNLGSYKLKN